MYFPGMKLGSKIFSFIDILWRPTKGPLKLKLRDLLANAFSRSPFLHTPVVLILHICFERVVSFFRWYSALSLWCACESEECRCGGSVVLSLITGCHHPDALHTMNAFE